MSTGSALAATEVTAQGAIRRAANSINEAVNAIRILNDRLESLKARVQGIAAEVRNEDEVPEPVRNDLEELEHQISMVHGGLAVLSNHLDDVSGI